MCFSLKLKGAEFNEISWKVANQLGLLQETHENGPDIVLSNTNSYGTFQCTVWIHLDRKSLKDKLHNAQALDEPHIMEKLTVVFPRTQMDSAVDLLIGRAGIKDLRLVLRTV